MATLLLEQQLAAGDVELAAVSLDAAVSACLCEDGYIRHQTLPSRLPAAALEAMNVPGLLAQLDKQNPHALHRTMRMLITGDTCHSELAGPLLPGIIRLLYQSRGFGEREGPVWHGAMTIARVLAFLAVDPAAAKVLLRAGLWKDALMLAERMSRLLLLDVIPAAVLTVDCVAEAMQCILHAAEDIMIAGAAFVQPSQSIAGTVLSIAATLVRRCCQNAANAANRYARGMQYWDLCVHALHTIARLLHRMPSQLSAVAAVPADLERIAANVSSMVTILARGPKQVKAGAPQTAAAVAAVADTVTALLASLPWPQPAFSEAKQAALIEDLLCTCERLTADATTCEAPCAARLHLSVHGMAMSTVSSYADGALLLLGIHLADLFDALAPRAMDRDAAACAVAALQDIHPLLPCLGTLCRLAQNARDRVTSQRARKLMAALQQRASASILGAAQAVQSAEAPQAAEQLLRHLFDTMAQQCVWSLLTFLAAHDTPSPPEHAPATLMFLARQLPGTQPLQRAAALLVQCILQSAAALDEHDRTAAAAACLAGCIESAASALWTTTEFEPDRMQAVLAARMTAAESVTYPPWVVMLPRILQHTILQRPDFAGARQFLEGVSSTHVWQLLHRAKAAKADATAAALLKVSFGCCACSRVTPTLWLHMGTTS